MEPLVFPLRFLSMLPKQIKQSPSMHPAHKTTPKAPEAPDAGPKPGLMADLVLEVVSGVDFRAPLFRERQAVAESLIPAHPETDTCLAAAGIF